MLATGGLSLAVMWWHWSILTDRKPNFFPDKDEGFFRAGSYISGSAENFLLWGPKSSDEPINIYSEKTTNNAFSATSSDKIEHFICF